MAGARPVGIELEFSKANIDSLSFQKCNCIPRYGIAFSYFGFNTPILGNGAMLSYFIEPSYRLNDHLKFNLRAAAGLIYASNPFDSLKNTENKSYTTNINPYLQVGLGFTNKISRHISITAMTGFQHFSNGGFKEPNRGVNWLTGSLGFLYGAGNNDYPKYKHSSFSGGRTTKIESDVGFLYVPQQGYNSKIMAQRKFIAGAFTQFTKQYAKISTLTAGLEMYYDKIEPAMTNSVKRNSLQAGIHAGHIFKFNKVSFSQQIGWQILKERPNADDFYYRYGLTYNISQHLLAGINLKAHSDNADFADFRVGVRF